MSARQLVSLQSMEKIDAATVEKVLIALSVHLRKRLVDLTAEDAAACPMASCVLQKTGKPLAELANGVRDSLIAKIERGCKRWENTRFLHTEPHHDDIMLGYLPAVLRSTRSATNDHHFVCGTSGFNSVSNKHMLMLLQRVEKFLQSPTYKRLFAEGYFKNGSNSNLDFRRRDVWKFLDGVAAADDELRDEGAARRLVANICDLYNDEASADAASLLSRIASLRSYFQSQYAGQKDVKVVQTLKGSCREFEAECVWGYIGWQLPQISHLRLGFYTADIFAPEPTQQRDVEPVLKLMATGSAGRHHSRP